MERILYTGNRNASSWAFRAWLALKEQNIEFEEKLLDIRRPQRWDNLAQLTNISPPSAVPVLQEGELVIFDSLAIMEYASEIGERALLPSDIKARAKARSFMAWQHSTFGRVCSCLFFESAFYPNKKELSNTEQKEIEWVYSIWQKTLNEYGGQYLVGEYSLADIMLLPSVVRFSSHFQPDERWPKVKEWFDRLLNRKYVKQWLDEAKQQVPIYLPGYRNDP